MSSTEKLSRKKAGSKMATEEVGNTSGTKTDTGKGRTEKQAKKAQNPSALSPSRFNLSLFNKLKKSPSKDDRSSSKQEKSPGREERSPKKEEKVSSSKLNEATKMKRSSKEPRKTKNLNEKGASSNQAATSSTVSSSKGKNNEESGNRAMVQTSLSNTKEGIEIVSSPEQPLVKLQRKKSKTKFRSNQSLENQSKEKTKKQTRIPSLFPLRKSSRKCKSEQEKEEIAKITNAILSKQQEGLEVRNIEDKGRGVFATRAFTKDEFVCEYVGELISQEEAKEREKIYGDNKDIGCYMYYLQCNNKKYCLDATEENGTFGRLLNHSRSGNCRTKLHVIKEKPHLILMTKRDVEKGEELTYDYGDRSKKALESHPWLKY